MLHVFIIFHWSHTLCILHLFSMIHSRYFLFKKRHFEGSSFRAIAKSSKKYRDFLCTPYPMHAQPPLLSTSPARGITFVTIDEPALTEHNHLKSVGDCRLHSGAVGWDKCIMTCIHHYNIMQSIFIVPLILCVPCIHSSPTPHPYPILWQPSIFLLSP